MDHLRVPALLRPALPWIKLVAVVALIASSDRPRGRKVIGVASTAYYASATTFHIVARDSAGQTTPAVVCGLLAASIT